MPTYKIRVTGEVLETPTATRRCKVEDEILTFGREAIYIEVDELPAKLSTDLYLRIDLVDADCVPAGAPVFTKKRRPPTGPDEILPLRSERVERDDADIHIHLRSERVENDDTEAINRLRSERVELQNARPGRKNR